MAEQQKVLMITAPKRWIKESQTPYNQMRIAQINGTTKKNIATVLGNKQDSEKTPK